MGKQHKLSRTPIWLAWFNLRQRVNNKNHNSYHSYGGRGIRVCERWKKFENFYEDMAETYKKGLSLDRIDVNGDYCKENCRWATFEQQCRNRRTNILYNGECAVDASLRLGGSVALVKTRLKMGWPLEKAFTVPVKTQYRNRHTNKQI